MSKSIRNSSRWTEKDLKRAKKQAPDRMSVNDFKAATTKKLLETDIQKKFFEQLESIPYKGMTLRDFVFAIPNGGYRSKKTGANLKKEGVKRGVPDTHCFIPVAPFHGLYIEFKTDTGDTSPDQVRVIRLLRQQGYKVVICRSTRSGMDELLKYLGI